MAHTGTAHSVSARPLSITLFATHAAPGGIRELWESLADGFNAKGEKASLWALYRHEEDGPSPDGAPSRWSYILPHHRSGKLGAVRQMFALAAWLRREKPDVIISGMPLANILLALLVRWFSPRTKIIETHHTPVETYHPLLRHLSRRSGTAKSVAAIVCVSRSVAQSLHLQPALYAAKCHVIPNAMAPAIEQQLSALAPSSLRIARSRLICAVGRLTEQKNFPILIRAAALLPDIRLQIIGGGTDADALAQLAENVGAAHHIEFLGQLPRAETLARLTQADIFVQISRWEGHSLALIEAAKLHLPLIVSDVPVQIEGITAQDGTICGLIASVDSPEDVANHIRMLLDDPREYRRLSDLSSKLGQEHGFERMCDTYSRLIKQVVSP